MVTVRRWLIAVSCALISIISVRVQSQISAPAASKQSSQTELPPPRRYRVRQASQTTALVSTLEGFARRALQDANATGFIDVRDVSSGQVLHVSSAGQQDLADNSLIPSLSIIKVYLAVQWLEHGFGSTAVACGTGPTVRRMLVDEVLISGCDSAAKRMAGILRRTLGSEQMLRELRRYGLDGISLRPDANDTEWGQVLSLGEDEVPVTPQQLSAFMRAIGEGGAGLFSERTARRVGAALEHSVQRGTADTIKNALAGTGWRIGGKTGTGPGQCGAHCDGWFASLLSDQDRPRYVILVFIRGRGFGSGLAAHTAASIAKYLIEQRPSTSSPANHRR